MHSFLIASAFISIVLAPCLVALHISGSDPGE
jgi:hypothetical protein